MKTLTIVVPSYNVEEYLDQALRSLVIPEYMEKLEVLIVNDGSTDNTAVIAEKYVKEYPETFVLINKENGGHGSAVNTGIDKATGKFFRILDGDDWLDTSALIKLLNILEIVDVDLVVTHYRTVNIDSGITVDLLFDSTICDKKITVSDSIKKNLFFPMATVCYKTNLLQQHNIRLQEKLFYVDEEYNVLPFAYTNSIYCCDCVLYNYRIGNVNQSISIKNQIDRIEHKLKVAERLVAFIEETTISADNKEYCYRKIQGLITSIYLIMLIYNSDKKQALDVVERIRTMLKNKSPLLYARTDKKYKIFRLMGFIPCKTLIYETFVNLGNKLSKKARVKYE